MSGTASTRRWPVEVPVIVALGSNLGDSPGLIRQTIRRLADRGAPGFRSSSLWQSSPVDCPPGSPSFINAVVTFDPLPGETPESLFAILQSWEREAGRRPKLLPNEPRPLDLDLIAFASEIRLDSVLVLPHPRAHLRRFVLEPLNEIDSYLILPGWSAPVGHLLTHLASDDVVTRWVPAA